MKRNLVLVAISLLFVGGAYGASLFVPIMFSSDAESLAVLQDIRENLESIESLTAEVDCQSNLSNFSFTDGSIAMKDDKKCRFDRGSSGEIAWRNHQAWNLSSPAYPGFNVVGLRWNDSIENAYKAWGRINGLVDLRFVVGLGENLGGLNALPFTVYVNNVMCKVIRSDDMRIYVDDQARHRVIRIEIDYVNSNSVAFRTDFLQWESCAGGQYPREIKCSHYKQLNHQGLIQLDYVLSNLESQVELDDSLFELAWLPTDTGNSFRFNAEVAID